MRARAPGKVVLSGAYSVLHGAPAIVSAVSRYVTADTARPAELLTDEVKAALAPGQAAPWFDASELREAGRKLGLGSSAAILVASLYALEREASPLGAEEQLRARVFQQALFAHRRAQGGGSGVDVAASSHGGTLCYRLERDGARWRPLLLPSGVHVEIWTCPVSASTRELLAAVAQLAGRDGPAHGAALERQAQAAEQAVIAADAGSAEGFVAALREQKSALAALGQAAAVPIVTPELLELAPAAEAEGGVLLPAGAGGGDIALFVGARPSSEGLRRALLARAHRRLETELSAPGVGVA